MNIFQKNYFNACSQWGSNKVTCSDRTLPPASNPGGSHPPGLFFYSVPTPVVSTFKQQKANIFFKTKQRKANSFLALKPNLSITLSSSKSLRDNSKEINTNLLLSRRDSARLEGGLSKNV